MCRRLIYFLGMLLIIFAHKKWADEKFMGIVFVFCSYCFLFESILSSCYYHNNCNKSSSSTINKNFEIHIVVVSLKQISFKLKTIRRLHFYFWENQVLARVHYIFTYSIKWLYYNQCCCFFFIIHFVNMCSLFVKTCDLLYHIGNLVIRHKKNNNQIDAYRLERKQTSKYTTHNAY